MAWSAQGRPGPRGPRGPQGPQGPPGPRGNGIRHAYVVHIWESSSAFVRVPAGNYVVFGNRTAMETAPVDPANPTANPPLAFGFSQAVLTSSEPPSSTYYHLTFTRSSVPNYGNQDSGRFTANEHFGSASLAASGTFTLPKAGTITLTCKDDGTQDPVAGHSSYRDFSLTAIPVASLHEADVGGQQS